MNPVRGVLLWSSTNPTLAHRLPRLPFVRRAVRRFLPGETIEDGLRAAAECAAERKLAVLTLLGENVHTADEAGAVAAHYEDVLRRVQAAGLPAEISIKPTHLGLDLGREVVVGNLERLLQAAVAAGNFVWIDMEGSAYTEVTLEVFRDLARRHRNVGLCLQSYLYRTEKDIESLLDSAPALRLVKGAYAEPEDIAYARKADVDEAFARGAIRMLERAARGPGFRPALATHDLALLERLRTEADRLRLARSAYEIQMLYGIGTAAQAQWAAEGHAVRVLISYGPAWFPWYMRRLAERPANLAFVLKSAFSS